MSILGRLWRLVDEMHSLPTKGSKRIERCATDAAKEIERLRRENAALCNKLAALENQTQWKCSCGGTDCEGQKENAALRSLASAMADEMEQHGGEMAFDSLARYRAALGKEDKP